MLANGLWNAVMRKQARGSQTSCVTDMSLHTYVSINIYVYVHIAVWALQHRSRGGVVLANGLWNAFMKKQARGAQTSCVTDMSLYTCLKTHICICVYSGLGIASSQPRWRSAREWPVERSYEKIGKGVTAILRD